MSVVYVHLAEGFEEIEAVTIIDTLRRAGLNAVSVSITGNLMVRGSHNIEMNADLLFEDVDYSKGEMIVLPGGMPGSQNLNEHKGLKSQILEYKNIGKYLAAICAAPIVFGGLGILKGKKAVCYPGFEGQLIDAKILSSKFVVDEELITGCGVGAALLFSLEIVRILVGEACSTRLRKTMLID